MPKESAQAPIFLDETAVPIINPGIEDGQITLEQERELVARSIFGCNESFGRLYELHRPKVFRKFYSKFRSRELAEDMTQETFISALRAMPNFESRGAPFISWLLIIAKNKAADYQQRRSIPTTALDFELQDTTTQNDPAEQTDIKEEVVGLRKAVKGLPERYGRAIQMRYLEDVDYAEIAERLDTSILNARNLVYRGLKALRADLKLSDSGIEQKSA